MPPTETTGKSRRIEELRAVETSPGVMVYRPDSIVTQLVTEGTRSPEPASATSTSVPRVVHAGD